jgi:hypothetical protein
MVKDLWRDRGKSRKGEIAVCAMIANLVCMKTSEYQGDSEPFSMPYSAIETVDRTYNGPDLDRSERNRVNNSPSGAFAAAIGSRGPFPFRTLIVCFTVWLIATQAMIFDQIRFETRAHLLEQAVRPLGPQVVIPNGRSSNLPNGAVQRL